jgi:hypothetical protein
MSDRLRTKLSAGSTQTLLLFSLLPRGVWVIEMSLPDGIEVSQSSLLLLLMLS